jgi:hypothetical protein
MGCRHSTGHRRPRSVGDRARLSEVRSHHRKSGLAAGCGCQQQFRTIRQGHGRVEGSALACSGRPASSPDGQARRMKRRRPCAGGRPKGGCRSHPGLPWRSPGDRVTAHRKRGRQGHQVQRRYNRQRKAVSGINNGHNQTAGQRPSRLIRSAIADSGFKYPCCQMHAQRRSGLPAGRCTPCPPTCVRGWGGLNHRRGAAQCFCGGRVIFAQSANGAGVVSSMHCSMARASSSRSK